ncbi:MAG: 50S ribosomal protein L24e [Nanoarchaeota archaeon]|nr:50S ribosomal protein L24e [Nanoarchaeota archaeon]MBU4352197.1 50S ribosomal protein L24e [Nanoarchaeota archaeon]MBU4456433.1 50S ribosomal protein L24e [Nanoarchaeota archaeon]MCG2719599.1 50S ribosomal protein L24e [Nanoarchaeota archaeon]
MPKCSFCNEDIEKGTGKLYVKKDAKQLNFCSKKCEKNMLKLKRVPRKMKWVTKKKKGNKE